MYQILSSHSTLHALIASIRYLSPTFPSTFLKRQRKGNVEEKIVPSAWSKKYLSIALKTEFVLINRKGSR